MAGDVTEFWSFLGIHLGVSDAEIVTIRENNVQFPSPKDKAHQMLRVWYEMGESSFGKLAKALEASGKGALVEKHC